jgi:conjugal transfer/type IV secretion protein DotA/TraY
MSDIPATSEVLLKSDASRQFLDSLLGQGWDAWGQGLGGSQGAELMLEMFSAFNIVALASISALFLWVLAVAVAGTAHEGVPFGKKYSSLWMPLRFVGAMGAMAPIFKGLSFFQVVILACYGLSINFGNFFWSMGTDYFVEHGGQLTVQAPDQNVTHYAAIANGSLESLTLQYYLNERRGLGVTPGGEWKYSGNWIRSGGEYRFTFNGNTGSIMVECVDESDALCRGKVNAVGTAISSLSSVASQLANPGTSVSDIDPQALHKAANDINATILSSLQSYAKQGQLKSKLQNFQESSEQYGWVYRRFFLLVNRLDQSGGARSHVFGHFLRAQGVHQLGTARHDLGFAGL